MNNLFDLDISPSPFISLRNNFFLAFYSDEDPRYEYQILIPNSCSFLPIEPDSPTFKSGFLPIANFETNEKLNSEMINIMIVLRHLKREIRIFDCIKLDMYGVEAKILKKLDASEKFGYEAEALVQLIQNGQKWLCRSRMIKDGIRLFRIDFKVPEEIYPKFIDTCSIVLKSFKLLHPEEGGSVEQLNKHLCMIPEELSFRYPSSWVIQQNYNSSNEYTNISLSGKFDGYIKGKILLIIQRYKNYSLLDCIREFLMEIIEELKNKFIYPIVNSPIFPFRPIANSRKTSIILLRAFACNKNYIIFPIIVAEYDNKLILLSLIPQSKDISNEEWAIQNRAFEIVRDTLKVE